MPYVETVADLAAHLADLLDIYNSQADWLFAHDDDCQCRGCWTGMMERRIRAAVAHDTLLASATTKEEV